MAKKNTNSNGADGLKAPKEKKLVNSHSPSPYAFEGTSQYGGYNHPMYNYTPEQEKEQAVGTGTVLLPYEMYLVKRGDSLYSIALNKGVNLDELLSFNEFELIDPATGLISHDGNEFQIQPGMNIKIPENADKGIKQETANFVVKEAAKSAENAEEQHMDSFFATLLDLSSNFLGPLNDSQITYSIDITIPIAGVLSLKLNGGFEQKRKQGEVIEHKIQLGIGLTAKIGNLVDAEIMFSLFLQAASDNVFEATELFSYGFYKFGRQIADNTNDFGTVVSSSGASLIPSAALYYGLNVMYSDKKVESVEDFKSPANAENNIAAMEARLFDKKGNSSKPFDENNPNEIAFGGAIKAGAKAENKATDSSVSAEAEFTYQNIINAQTLNTTGIYGAQDIDKQGFFEDYELGSKSEMSIKLQGATEFEGNGVSFSTAITFENQNNEKEERGRDKVKSSGWQFSKLENEIALTIKDLTKKTSDTVKLEITNQVAAMVSKFIENFAEANQKAKEKNLQTLSTGLNPVAISTQIGDSLTTNSLNAVKGVKATDKMQLKLKMTKESEQVSKLNLTIGILNEKELDVGLVEGKMIRFTPAINITLKL